MGMELSLADRSVYPEASEGDLDVALSGDFGNYAVLTRSDDEFIQAAEARWVTRETDDTGVWCEDYSAKTAHIRRESDRPALYVLEYCDSPDGEVFIATGVVSRDEVREVLRDYMRGGSRWRTARKWEQLTG